MARKPAAKRGTVKGQRKRGKEQQPAPTPEQESLGSAKQQAFLLVYAQMGNIVRAAAAAGCHYRSHQYWMRHDPTYPERFKQARAEAGEYLEAEALRRAMDGLREPLYYKGRQLMAWMDDQGNYVTEGTEGAQLLPVLRHRYSDKLLLELLRAAKPKKYAKRHELKHKNAVPVRIESREEKIKRVQDAIQKMRDKGELPPAQP